MNNEYCTNLILQDDCFPKAHFPSLFVVDELLNAVFRVFATTVFPSSQYILAKPEQVIELYMQEMT